MMGLAVLPVEGERYAHRLVEHRPDGVEYCPVVVLAVVPDGARTWVVFRYLSHRNGRRDAAVASVEEFHDVYPHLVEDGAP